MKEWIWIAKQDLVNLMGWLICSHASTQLLRSGFNFHIGTEYEEIQTLFGMQPLPYQHNFEAYASKIQETSNTDCNFPA